MNIENDWQLSPELIHLNHAAVGPWPVRTKIAIQEFAEDNANLGSLHYLKWIETEAELRHQLKKIINAQSDSEISLLKNTSAGLSVIAYGLDWKKGDNVVISDQEFPSNYIVWESLKNKGVEIRYAHISVDNPENALIEKCDSNTRLLSVSSVQYATGLKLNLVPVGDYCEDNNILFCIDAIQSIGAHQFDVQACKADFVVADGHKWMLGPEGTALFYCREKNWPQLSLNQYGWRMVEDFLNFDNKQWQVATNGRRFECGSPNMLGIHGLHASLSLLLEIGIKNIQKLIDEKLKLIINLVSDIPDIKITSPIEVNRRAGIITFQSTKISTDALFEYLSKHNVFCAIRGGSIRFSPHYYTSDEKIIAAIKLVSQAQQSKN